MNTKDVLNHIEFNLCRMCPIGYHWCYTWNICVAKRMEIIAYNMILRGEF